ncbi:hypothetical protein MMC30_000314 [Trapelia coarctata]|nr:hypothetical protein [Trapelia coarctata]
MQPRLQTRGTEIIAAHPRKNGPTTAVRPSQLTGPKPITTTTAEISEAYQLQLFTEEKCRRPSLLPQRSSSVRHPETGQRQSVDSTHGPTRIVSAARAAGGLQRPQSTTKVGHLRQQFSDTHQRQSSVNQFYSDKIPIPTASAPRLPITRDTAAERDSLPQNLLRPPALISTHTTPSHEVDTGHDGAAADFKAPRREHKAGSIASAKSVHRKQTSLSQRPPSFAPSRQRGQGNTGQERIRSAEAAPSTASSEPEKPSFSTLQQHFTPKRAPTDPTPSFSTKLQIEQHAADRLSREYIELKLGLLQLHMLHRNSSTIQQEWQRSAEDRFRARFFDLASAHKSVAAREGEFQEQVNASAFIAWGSGTDGLTIEHKVLVLSSILSDVWDLSEPNGKYSCLLESFEHWHSRACRVLQLQRQPNGNQTSLVSSMEGIGDGWKAEVALLQSKIRTFHEQIRALGEVQPQSDLARCLGSLSSMLSNMMEELDLVQRIEGQVVLQGQTWIKKSIDRLAADVTYDIGGRFGPTPVASSGR